jgi:hypothetical protein
MSSNYPAILEGIRARFEAVVGVPAYGYDPKGYSSDMHLRFIGVRGRPIESASGEMAIEWEIKGRLVVRYTSNETAETLLAAKVPLLVAAMGQDLDAGGSLADGQALPDLFTWVYFSVVSPTSTTDYRSIDFPVKAIERFPFDYAL